MKRLFDLLLAAVALVTLAPVFFSAAIIVFLCMGRPILFWQTRPGLNRRPFEIIKFRTMAETTDLDGNILPDCKRLTACGRFLRSTSMDELPELWNVIKGDMNIVGPRPLLMEYLPLYNARQARRHEVKPGMTGWAQVNGRNATTWEERFELDIWYVENQSFSLDLKIIWMTVRTVLNRRGISHEGSATMEKFKGTP